MSAQVAKNMEQKRVQNPSDDPRPTCAVATSDAAPGGGGSTSARPPHPLFGGGGGNALTDQIKAKAAQRNARVESAGGAAAVDPAANKPKKSIESVLPPGSKPGGMQTASLADQVAMLAAKCKQQLEIQEQSTDGGAAGLKITEPPAVPRTAPPPVRPSTDPKLAPAQPYTMTTITKVKKQSATMTTTSTVPNAAAAAVAAKKKEDDKAKSGGGGWFGGGKKATAETNKENDAFKVKRVVPPPPTPPKPEPPKPTFQQAQLRSTNNKTEPESSASSSAPPIFSQAKLKPTGIALDLAPVEPGSEADNNNNNKAQESAPAPPMEGPTEIRRVTPGVAAPPTQHIKCITKGETEYEVVEYKCACTIL